MEKNYGVGGMTCSACALGIEKRVGKIAGVQSVAVSLMERRMTVVFSDGSLEKEIIAAVRSLGYSVYSLEKGEKAPSSADDLKKRFFLSLFFLIPLLYFSMGGMLGFPKPSRSISFAIQGALAFGVVLIGRKFYLFGARALLKGVPNMDTLVALASAFSYLYSLVVTALTFAGKDGATVFFEASAMVPTLVTLGKFWEEKSKARTGDEIEKLLKMMPQTVCVRKGGAERSLPLSDVRVGDEVVLRVGDRVPVDGKIVFGACFADESAITGENLPAERSVGDSLLSGGVIASGFAVMQAEKVGEDSTFSRVIQLVRSAAASKAPVQRVADKIAGVFVPIVAVLSLLTFVLWFVLTKSPDRAFLFGVSVLVVSCPCALGLATPVAVMAAAGKGASIGVLFKDAASVETLAEVDLVLLDKTATLTEGKPEVVRFENLGGVSERELFSLIYAAESRSSHPLAACIKDYCGKSDRAVDAFEYMLGKGGIARIEGKTYYIGNAALFPYPLPCEKEGEGETVVWFGDEERALARFLLRDKIKAGAKETVAALSAHSIRSVLCTGDRAAAAERVGKEIGVSEMRAEMLPSEKAAVARAYKEKGFVVAMTGDGINDAPALKAADVGIAMGSGTDVAIDSADVVLRSGDIRTLADAILLAKKTFRIIKGNLFWAFFYNLIAIPVAAGAFSSLGLFLTPSISAAAMSLSSLFVVTNALRINGYRRVIPIPESESKLVFSCASRENSPCGAPRAILSEVLAKDVQKLDRSESTDRENVITEKNALDPLEKREEKTQKEEGEMLFKKEPKIILSIEGMMCEHCKARVEKALAAVDGVTKVKVDLAAKSATVFGNADKTALIAAVAEAGYSASL